jgi:hypothetical protein
LDDTISPSLRLPVDQSDLNSTQSLPIVAVFDQLHNMYAVTQTGGFYDVRSEATWSYSFENPSRRQYKVWDGWSVGAYVHAWLPNRTADDTIRTWRNHPVLLIDVYKEGTKDVRFIVARLYDQDTAAKRFDGLSRVGWPADSKYVLSNDFELLYKWELRTWFRSDTPSVAKGCAIDKSTNRLVRCEILPTTDLGRALSVTPKFERLLELPREALDIIYGYAIADEGQGVGGNFIHLQSLICRKRAVNVDLPRHHGPIVPTSSPLPWLQTPGIFRVCRKIRTEAMEVLYRIKTLIVAVTSPGNTFVDLKGLSIPDVSRFLHIRVEFVLENIESDVVRKCFAHVTRLLRKCASSLQYLEIRVGHSAGDSLANFCEPNVTKPAALYDNMKRSMLELVPLFENHERTRGIRFKPLELSWGISEAQRAAGDYSCARTYLTASFLCLLWKHIYGNSEQDESSANPLLVEEERCRCLSCNARPQHPS